MRSVRRVPGGYAFVSVGFYPDPTRFAAGRYYAYLLAGVVFSGARSYGAVVLPLCTGGSPSTCSPSLRRVCSRRYGCKRGFCLFHALDADTVTWRYIYGCGRRRGCSVGAVTEGVLRFVRGFPGFTGELVEAGFAGFNADIASWVYPHLENPVAKPEELEGVLHHYTGLYFPQSASAFQGLVALVRGG